MIKRGEIYFIRNSYIPENESDNRQKSRPAVIVSNDLNNTFGSYLEVVYLTTQYKKDLPTHFVTDSALYRSTVLCENVYSVHKDRTESLVGQLTKEEMTKLDKCLAISLGLHQSDSEEHKNAADSETLEKQLADIRKKQQEAEQQALKYKEMYDFILGKYLN